MLYTGIDIVEIARIRRAVERWGNRFLQHVFTPAERADCGLEGIADPEIAIHAAAYASLAARWAAKEAAAKALGVGLRGLGADRTTLDEEMPNLQHASGVGWTEIEIVRGSLGRPQLRLHGTAAAVAAQMGLGDLAVSLSHTSDYAVAHVVGIGNKPSGA